MAVTVEMLKAKLARVQREGVRREDNILSRRIIEVREEERRREEEYGQIEFTLMRRYSLKIDGWLNEPGS